MELGCGLPIWLGRAVLAPVVHQDFPNTSPILCRFYHTRGHYPGPTIHDSPALRGSNACIFFRLTTRGWCAKALGTSRNLTMSPITRLRFMARSTSTRFFSHFPHGSSYLFSRVLALFTVLHRAFRSRYLKTQLPSGRASLLSLAPSLGGVDYPLRAEAPTRL